MANWRRLMLLTVVPGGGSILMADLLANYPASGYQNYTALVSDIGPNGMVLRSNGTQWLANGPQVLSQSGAGYILPGVSASSTASLTTNVVTVINGGAGPTAHNIPATTFDGYNVYFPGSSNIPAGWYPGFARTSTTAYTFNYTHGNVGGESVNAAGAYTTETTAVTVTLPGGLMGLNGALRFHSFHDTNNSAGAKTIKAKFGTATILQYAPTTTLSNRFDGPVIHNLNSASAQIGAPSSGGFAVAGGASGAASQLVRTAVNTAADVTILYTLTCAVATDFVTLGAYSMTVYPC